jgi:hypothetical protein
VRAIFTILIALSLLTSAHTSAGTWAPIRTAPGSNPGTWQYVVCEPTRNGWNNCEQGLIIVLTAAPPTLAALGEVTYITATVTDAYGSLVEASIPITWTTTSGTLGASVTYTNANGQTVVSLKSSSQIGGATVTASGMVEGGSGSIWIPFTDKWAAIAPTYTSWTPYGALFNCSAWSPDAATVAQGSSFTQQQVCTQNYYQYVQAREQSLVTGQVRNVGGLTTNYTSGQITNQQTAVGTMAPAGPSCAYSGSTWIGTNSGGCRGNQDRGKELNLNGQRFFPKDSGGLYSTNPYPVLFWVVGGVKYYPGKLMSRSYASCAQGESTDLLRYEACHD